MKNTLLCKGLVLLICLVFSFSLVSGCKVSSKKKKLTIFHAGSLSIPFKYVSEAFEKKYPDVEILRESSGSVAAARKISDLGRQADIMASADYTVIEDLLIPKYTDFLIKFATNEMAIMYSEHSKYADKINENNWYEILLKEGVNYGRSDPNIDPCGYRTLLVWQLAEKHYEIDNLYQKLLTSCPKKNIRPKETDLLSLLEAGELDYLFIYRSVAEQHKGKYLLLPDKINLKTDKNREFYNMSKVEIAGKKPGELITKKGEPMVYGITAIKDSPNYDLAIKFIEFLVGLEGQAIMQKNGQPPINPFQGIGNVPKMLDSRPKPSRE